LIFLTVGTQLPFDRLVRALDDFAAARGMRDIFGQIADPGPQGYRPKNFPFVANITPAEFEQRCREAQLIVAHAGMGSLITAMTFGKPILVMPRRGDLGEHRNDHQVATAAKLGSRPGVAVAADAAELAAKLEAMLAEPGGQGALPPFAEPRLIEAVRAVVLGRKE
jgi:UDP-N-acetylglucosamine transferase subunit ALG13